MARVNLFFVVLLGMVLFRYSSCCKSNDVAMDKFKEFASKYNKTYKGPEEFQKRFKIFADKLKEIERLNEEAKGLTTYRINEFSDLTWEEFKGKRLIPFPLNAETISIRPNNFTAPKRLRYLSGRADWTPFMTRIKNQGNCGSCWAFAATAVVECLINIKLGSPMGLSEQHLIDCSSAGSCEGGWPAWAFEYARDYGLVPESSYPYSGSNGICHFMEESRRIKISGVKAISSDEEEMASVILKEGPIVVYFRVGRAFEMYGGGLLTATGCNTQNFGHAVTLVGYGEKDGQPYWIGRNSWGTGWGEKGYFRVPRGVNWCGLATGPVTGYITR